MTGGARLRAVCDLLVPDVRDSAGRHEYDGVVPDLSPEAVQAGLTRLGGERLADPHDEAHLSAVERRLHTELGQVQLHRRDPRRLLAALDLSVYDRPYAPAEQRAAARARHLAGWPDGVDAALRSLDLVSAPAASALVGAVRGAVSVVSPDEPGGAPARAAGERLLAHLQRCAASGDPDPALGGRCLTALLGDGEAQQVDLPDLAATASRERDRLRAALEASADRIAPGVPAEQVVADAVLDHPDAAGVLDEARALTAEVLGFVRQRRLVDDVDGECLVAPTPPSRRWATATLSWAAAYEPDGPSTFSITPPDPAWPAEQQRQWLRSANRTTMPSTTAHEVAPGHFCHGRALRRLTSDVRRSLHSPAFVEGWAHYAEELMVEEGFRDGDPRFALGVAMKALMRVTRLTVSIGVHTGSLGLDEAARLFERDAFLQGPAARAEALRAVFDPTYGRYTLGKLALRELRGRALVDGMELRQLHRRVMALGAPPLGLLPAALDPPG